MTAHLFLGICFDPQFEKLFFQLDPAFVIHYVGIDEMSLQEIFYEGNKYIGKWAGESATLENLEQLQVNILSILKKLVPNYPYENVSFQLLPILLP